MKLTLRAWRRFRGVSPRVLRLSRTKRDQSLDSVNGAAIAESEAGSLDDYVNANPRKYNEDASYIGP